jgi:hypothetical protein
MFISASSIGLDNSMLKDAILALASCNISRRHAEKKSTSRENMGAMGPSLVHQTRSQLYYSSSIKKFISLTPMDYQSNSNVIFTVLVLFAYIESSMGNFEGFYCHVQGLAKFLMDLEAVIGGATLRPLLAAWMQVRFLVWWARAYFSSIEVHRQLPSIPLPKMLEGIAESLEERRVGILSIMCESHRLNFKEALNYWPHSPGREDTAREDINGASELRQTIHLLSVQAKRSDQWLLSLPESEQPLHWVESQHCFEGLGEINEPIIFQSHDAALNFAYFVVGRIMQCTTTLRRLQNPNLEEELSNEEESWARILIQIAKATNMKTSIIKNTYTIGFSGLLLAAISRFQSLELGIEIENWLRELKDMHPTEEGAFPVYQSLGVVKAINQQRMMGCQIFGVTQQVDDGGGNPKFTAYNSQFLNTVLVHGRCTFTGQLFTKCVSIDL